MIVAAARELAGQRVCFVGVGLPNIAVNLAKRTVAPDLELVYEAGVFGARAGPPAAVASATRRSSPARPRSRACSSCSATTSRAGSSTSGSSGAAQIDRFGNINTTVIGDYAHPTTRLPGSGGACEIAINARQVFVIMRQSKRSFVERIDFRTSPGNLGGAETGRADPARAGLARARAVGRGHRPRHLPLRRDRRDAPRLAPSRARRSTQVRATIGWEPKVCAGRSAETPAPTDGRAAAHPRASSTRRASTRSRAGQASAGPASPCVADHQDRAARRGGPRGPRRCRAGTGRRSPRSWLPDDDQVGALRLRRRR